MAKTKRKLNPDEIMAIMDQLNSPNPPTMRELAKRYSVNQPSIAKALGKWIKGSRQVEALDLNATLKIDYGTFEDGKIVEI